MNECEWCLTLDFRGVKRREESALLQLARMRRRDKCGQTSRKSLASLMRRNDGKVTKSPEESSKVFTIEKGIPASFLRSRQGSSSGYGSALAWSPFVRSPRPQSWKPAKHVGYMSYVSSVGEKISVPRNEKRDSRVPIGTEREG